MGNLRGRNACLTGLTVGDILVGERLPERAGDRGPLYRVSCRRCGKVDTMWSGKIRYYGAAAGCRHCRKQVGVRDEAIAGAVAANVPVGAVAAAYRLTETRIYQIVGTVRRKREVARAAVA